LESRFRSANFYYALIEGVHSCRGVRLEEAWARFPRTPFLESLHYRYFRISESLNEELLRALQGIVFERIQYQLDAARNSQFLVNLEQVIAYRVLG